MILVYGDAMTDMYVGGRLRPNVESTIPIFVVGGVLPVPGGAANVAMNIASLGLQAILLAPVGIDPAASALFDAVDAVAAIEPIFLQCPERSTPCKSRYMLGERVFVRIDSERADPLTEAAEANVLDRLRQDIGKAQAVVVSDYGKGAVTARIAKAIVAEAHSRQIPTIIDSKQPGPLWAGATVIKPNLHEIAAALACQPPRTAEEAVAAASTLRERAGVETVLLTRGEDGMALADKSGVTLIRGLAIEVADVIGAGDTAAAALAVGLAAGQNMVEAARFANTAAAIVVSKVGTACVTMDEVEAFAHQHRHDDRAEGRQTEGQRPQRRLH
jgi:D-beta-D-heptose 7-phosphate kinase/D-beta-D-heptose 1-phosphate adenosyltransferase